MGALSRRKASRGRTPRPGDRRRRSRNQRPRLSAVQSHQGRDFASDERSGALAIHVAPLIPSPSPSGEGSQKEEPEATKRGRDNDLAPLSHRERGWGRGRSQNQSSNPKSPPARSNRPASKPPKPSPSNADSPISSTRPTGSPRKRSPSCGKRLRRGCPAHPRNPSSPALLPREKGARRKSQKQLSGDAIMILLPSPTGRGAGGEGEAKTSLPIQNRPPHDRTGPRPSRRSPRPRTPTLRSRQRGLRAHPGRGRPHVANGSAADALHTRVTPHPQPFSLGRREPNNTNLAPLSHRERGWG